MVFSKLFQSITSVFDNTNTQNIKKHNNKPINELQQGMLLLKKRQNDINRLSKSKLMEPMSASMKTWTDAENKLKNLSKKELDDLKTDENEYNKELSSYGTKYKAFMEKYYIAVENVEKCKAKCLNKYPIGTSRYSDGREACSAGCDIKGPYVSKCENTFTKSRIGGGTCDTAALGKCIDGKVQLGADSYIDDMNRADSNNVTLRKGCCICGGGGGGKPSAKIRGKNIKSCDNIASAFGATGSHAVFFTSACKTAPNETTSNSLLNDYSALATQNKILIEKAEKIFKKISKFNTLNGKLNMEMTSQRSELQDTLDEYSSIYLQLQDTKKYGNVTMDAQAEDIYLKEKNQMLQLGIWGSLAILLVLVTLDKLKK